MSFAGATGYTSASTSATLTVSKEIVALSYTGATLLGTGIAQPVSALLKDMHGVALVGKTVTFTVGTTAVSVATNASGVASTSITLSGSSATNGPGQLQVAFAGDANYNAASATIPVEIFLFTGFVVWGGNALTGALKLGQDVNFWGPNWASQVTAGTFSADPSFRGFASTAISPVALCEPGAGLVGSNCGRFPGGSGAPSPPASLPNYIGVMNATQIERTGTETYGNISAMAVLKVDATPVYGNSQTQSGNGVIVAIIADNPVRVFPIPVQFSVTQTQTTLGLSLPGQPFTVKNTILNNGQTIAKSVAVNESFDGVTPATGVQTDASLSPSQQFISNFSVTPPTYPVRQSGESSAAYSARLAAVDGRLFTSEGTITFTDAQNQPYLPITITSNSHLQIPRLAVYISGPPCVPLCGSRPLG